MATTKPLTLCIDCGGGGIKGSVVDGFGTVISPPVRKRAPYPMPPHVLLRAIADIAKELPPAARITVGMPGMIRHGRVIETPHYVTKDGPRSKVLPELVTAWANFNMKSAVEKEFGLPTIVLNDAEVAGAGVVTGTGLEMIITLGTGLGNAIFDNGRLAPHAELSQGLVRWGMTYDDYIGEHERLRLGDAHWSRRVRRVIDSLRPVYVWDRLYLGGGNASRIITSERNPLPQNVIFVQNEAGIFGGVRTWDLVGGS